VEFLVEDQLMMAWSYVLPEGKNKLRIDISFIYEETTQAVVVRTQQTTRRGGVTATKVPISCTCRGAALP